MAQPRGAAATAGATAWQPPGSRPDHPGVRIALGEGGRPRDAGGSAEDIDDGASDLSISSHSGRIGRSSRHQMRLRWHRLRRVVRRLSRQPRLMLLGALAIAIMGGLVLYRTFSSGSGSIASSKKMILFTIQIPSRPPEPRLLPQELTLADGIRAPVVTPPFQRRRSRFEYRLQTKLASPAPLVVLQQAAPVFHKQAKLFHRRAFNASGEQTLPPTGRINVYPGARAGRLHGILGLDKSGLPLWKPLSPPSGEAALDPDMSRGGFNLRLSDSLPLDRVPKDQRDEECKTVDYDLNSLPRATVVTIFHNEPFSTLLRSVHSVLNLSPPEILEEIILVDDGSTKEVPNLEAYVASLPKVKLVRNPTRTGIVGARLLGIKHVVSKIFVILDSHIEVQPGWLEPLVQRIAENPKVVIMPLVESIDPRTFEYNKGGIGCTLGFLWKMMEHAFSVEPQYPTRYNQSQGFYVESPTMAGGLFAANTQFFNQVGGYDRGMTFWGTENLELSFRLWQCGGILECARCSRVFHIFRSGGSGYTVPDPHALTRNKLRTMAVWMDEYADLAWRVMGKPQVSIGDISERLSLRRQLHCKPFSYFLNTVWPEGDVKDLRQDVPFLGRLQNLGAGLCLSNPSSAPLTPRHIGPCSNTNIDMMYFRRTGRIMPLHNDESCLYHTSLNFDWCRPETASESRWEFNKYGQIVSRPDEASYLKYLDDPEGNPLPLTKDNQCLGIRIEDPRQLELSPCLLPEMINEHFAAYQRWTWEAYNPPSLWEAPT